MRGGSRRNTGARRIHPAISRFTPYSHPLLQERHSSVHITRSTPVSSALVVPDLLTPPLLPANNVEANGTAGLPPPLGWIPQVPYVPARNAGDFTPAESVSFSTNGVTGISVSQAVAGKYAGLDGRDDGISSFQKSRASCRIQFTGYHPRTFPINTRHHNAGWTPIKRCKLAREVGRRVKEYIEGQGLQGTFALEKIYLARLTHVSKGSWQPELILLP